MTPLDSSAAPPSVEVGISLANLQHCLVNDDKEGKLITVVAHQHHHQQEHNKEEKQRQRCCNTIPSAMRVFLIAAGIAIVQILLYAIYPAPIQTVARMSLFTNFVACPYLFLTSSAGLVDAMLVQQLLIMHA
jgi:hypothetical protein